MHLMAVCKFTPCLAQESSQQFRLSILLGMMWEVCVQIVEVVQPLREQLNACLVFPSMPAVMRLNKLGTFQMSQLGQSKSPVAEFMRSMRKSNDNFEESMLKLVRTLPAVLKFLPSQKAQVGFLPPLQGQYLPASSTPLQGSSIA